MLKYWFPVGFCVDLSCIMVNVVIIAVYRYINLVQLIYLLMWHIFISFHWLYSTHIILLRNSNRTLTAIFNIWAAFSPKTMDLQNRTILMVDKINCYVYYSLMTWVASKFRNGANSHFKGWFDRLVTLSIRQPITSVWYYSKLMVGQY